MTVSASDCLRSDCGENRFKKWLWGNKTKFLDLNILPEIFNLNEKGVWGERIHVYAYTGI